MTDSISNRRKHVRIYRNFILSYRTKNAAVVKKEMSQVNNISQGGINFSTTNCIETGTEIIIEVKTPFLSEKVEIEGIVLEAVEKIPKLIYSIRVEFRNLTEESIEILRKIEQYSSQQG